MDLHPWAFSYFTTIDWHLGIYIISPPLVFRVSLDVQGHILSFGFQSHHHFLSLTFRAAFPVPAFRAIIIVSQFRRSEPLLLRLTFRVVFSFGVQSHYIVRSDVQSHCRFSVLAFRAITIFSFGVQSHCRFSVLAFRAITIFSFGVQSHCRFSVLAFRAITIFSFGVQSHCRFSVLAFRAITIFSLAFRAFIAFQFGIQSLYRFLVSAFRAIIVAFQFGVQSHHRFSDRVQSHHHHFSVSAFRAIIGFQIDIQSRILGFSVQSRYHWSSSSLLSLTFRVIIITSQFRRSEPSSVFRSTFRVTFSVSAFRAIVTPQFDIQSHIPGFGVQSHHYQTLRHFFRRSKPCFASFGVQSYVSLHSVFRAIIASLFGVQSHHSSVLVFRAILVVFSVSAFRAIIGFSDRHSELYFLFKCLESALSSRVTTPGVHIRWLCASCLHGFTLSLGFSSLRYPVLIAYSSCSPHRVVPFGRILARTLGWFDRYSSLTLIS
ncbi:hypothetical protein CK203_091465 [Vitis vinifera]|uniref:Uncharacterized protein n=1 Tax=Vitis vinifera TaxID=29760 RepID=A0A438ECY8_VITVI|nr:hypothetical protein CK203_091465 [Vitis vinifera]